MKFTPDRSGSGLREVGQPGGMLQGSVDHAARAVAAHARADDPRGAYEVQQSPVLAGWNNEARAGGRVVETKRGKGAERHTLVRAAREARS